MSGHEATNSWFLYRQQKSQAEIRLFCFHYAGGGASIFRKWSTLFSPYIEVWPVQLPGREYRLRERAFSDLAMLTPVLENIISPYLDKPYAFFGHSMGALVSFELAHYLYQKYQTSPTHLFVSAHHAPQTPHTNSSICHLPDAQFIEKIRHMEGTPEQILQNAELMQLFLPLLRADFTLCETYVYQHKGPLSCPISAFGGLKDSMISQKSLAAWREQTKGAFSLRLFEGNHFFLHQQEKSLIQAISQDILRISG